MRGWERIVSSRLGSGESMFRVVFIRRRKDGETVNFRIVKILKTIQEEEKPNQKTGIWSG